MALNASFKDDTIKSLPSKSSRLIPFNLICPLRVLNSELAFFLSCAIPLRLKPEKFKGRGQSQKKKKKTFRVQVRERHTDTAEPAATRVMNAQLSTCEASLLLGTSPATRLGLGHSLGAGVSGAYTSGRTINNSALLSTCLCCPTAGALLFKRHPNKRRKLNVSLPWRRKAGVCCERVRGWK